MRFPDLSEEDKEYIIQKYREADLIDGPTKDQVQEELSDKYDVSKRTIRTWVAGLGLVPKINISDAKILIYDIETSRMLAKTWWTGKRYIGPRDLVTEATIISIAWKWLGTDKVEYLTWDENHCDKKMLKEFLNVYNSADMVVGQNNDRFDNRWINARAMKHRLDVNVFVKSFDIMKQTKRLFRLPSYSMDYVTKFLGVENKLEHEGIKMWDMIEDGTPKEQEEYLEKMCVYNIGDIISTEAMYTTLRKYMGNKVHFGVLLGGEKFSCPNCGGLNLTHVKPTSTPAGTLRHIMKCEDDGVQFQLSHKQYLNFLNYTGDEK